MRRPRRHRIHTLTLSLILIAIALIAELLAGMPIFHARGDSGWQLSWNELLDAVQEKSIFGSGNYNDSSEKGAEISASAADSSATAGDMEVHFIDVMPPTGDHVDRWLPQEL